MQDGGVPKAGATPQFLSEWTAALPRQTVHNLRQAGCTLPSWLLDCHVEALLRAVEVTYRTEVTMLPQAQIIPPAVAAMLGQSTQSAESIFHMLGDDVFNFHPHRQIWVPLNSQGAGADGFAGVHWSLMVLRKEAPDGSISTTHFDSARGPFEYWV